MEKLVTLFYILLLIDIYHNVRKIVLSRTIFLKLKDKEDQLTKEIIIFDNFELFFCLFGIFFDESWHYFLGIFILSYSHLQRVSSLCYRVDAIITLILILAAYYARIFGH